MKKLLFLIPLVCLYFEAFAQSSLKKTDSISTPEVRLGTVENPEMKATRIQSDGQIILDGKVDEKIWHKTPVATGFSQRVPNNGKPATEKTEIRILYTDAALYIGIMAFDSSPDSIMASLFRRDGNEASDWVFIGIDSYNDKRTAFLFGINPRGVQNDRLLFDDNDEDILWDAVWEGKTQMLKNGWSAELKIPLSQLRFSSKTTMQNWGINFARDIARNGETSFWAPTSQNSTGIVSKFGRLTGIQDLKEPRRLEVIPYVSADITRVPEITTSNPYYRRNEFTGGIGGDVKYGVTSDLTLTATINPDFGQVEADPAVINLTANESFFSERRPFFLEGNDIFRFGDTKTYSRFGNPATFYSRRIGRSPQGNTSKANINAEYADQPDFTSIAAAAKLSGKSKNGWSVGLLDAYTLKENANYTDLSGNEGTVAVEPATNYLVARTKKDINEGNTYFGGFVSAVNRNINNTYFQDFLRTSAYLGGVDFEHNFNNRNWVASGTVSYSVINGSKEAINLAQNSSARYLDRVDSDKLSVDPQKTSLAGFATEISIQKRGGDDHWLTSLTYSEVSPGYETNDIGFMNRADYRSVNGGIVYRETDPQFLEYYEFWTFTGNAWNYDGDRINHNYSTGGFIRLKNLWRVNFNANYNGKQYSDRNTRGGPIMERPTNVNFNTNINSNSNKKISFQTGTFQRKNTDGGFYSGFWGGIKLLPTTFIQLNISPEYEVQKSKEQYITTVQDANASATYNNRYVFSDIKQHTLSMSVRLNWTFSPKMSLQTYIRPFISTGDFENFKEFAQPGTNNFEKYGVDKGTITEGDNNYTVDPDGSGSSPAFSIRDPDFNFRSVQGNAVFRWEYTPGSTLYLVWQQQRNDSNGAGSFDLGRDFDGLFSAKPTNVFLVKISYWFGS